MGGSQPLSALKRPFAGAMPAMPELGPPPTSVKVPTPPWVDTKSAVKAIDEQNEAIREGIVQRERIAEQKKIITDVFIEKDKEFMSDMRMNMDLQMELTSNPPTYRKALANLNWGQKLAGILDAAFNGHTYENPMRMIDSFVAKELQDQVTQYNQKLGGLQREQTMYSQFLKLNKNHYDARYSVQAVLYEDISKRIESYGQIVKNEKDRVLLNNLNQEVRYKHDMEIYKLEESKRQKAFDNGIKIIGQRIKIAELGIKEREMQRKEAQIGAGVPMGMKQTEAIDRRVDFGGKAYYDIPKQELSKKEGVRDVIRASKKSARGSYDLEKVGEKITKGSAFKSLFAGLPWTDLGEKERANFETLNKGLIKLMLKSRIEFTGGGNMSQQEQHFLREFYEVKEGRWVLKNSQKVLKILMGLGRGDYETLFKIVRKDAFFNALTEMEKSPSFNIQEISQKYKETAKDLGISNKDLADYIKGINYR